MDAKELLKVALRVLVACNDGHKPVPADLRLLQEAFPAYADWAHDDLASQAIRALRRGLWPQRYSGEPNTDS